MQWTKYVSVALVMGALISNGYGETARDTLPIKPAPFAGKIGENVTDSMPDPNVFQLVQAPDQAPNIFVMMSDDVGFAMASTFGGPVPTPNFDRLADQGIRYNRFHTSAICSPTRAALLTGRNPHNTGTGYLTDAITGYPSYQGRISDETASIAQVLKLNGYNTAMFGKHHNVPYAHTTANGPFNQWPTGLGFEYFFGYLGPETHQFQPNLYRGTSLLPNDNTMQLLDARMADDAINWIHNQQAPGSGKPFFIYFAPSSTHAPHQAPAELIESFKGQFDQGWDKVREETWRRQIEMGIIPPDTTLTPRPDEIPAWDSLSAEQKAFAARSMEVAAAMLAYQDEQIGRVLTELERMGLRENTLVSLILGDNGASADGALEGYVNRTTQTNHIAMSEESEHAYMDTLGGPDSYANYQAGWAWAMNTPLRWTKQYSSMLGGIRNGMILSWPGRMTAESSVCPEFSHVVDIAPTLLEAANLPVPKRVYGVDQKPMDGQSLLSSLSNCMADRPRTQYFETGGKVGLWHNGWFASNDDGRTPWQPVPEEGPNPPTVWSLYHLDEDFSQSTDLADAHPQKLQELIALWRQEAEKNQVYPLDHSFGAGRKLTMPVLKDRYEFWGKNVSIPATAGPMFTGRSFTLDATLDLPSGHASGAVVALGSRLAGWSFFLDEGKPAFVYALTHQADHTTRIAAPQALPSGNTTVRLTFEVAGMGQAAEVSISANGKVLAEGRIPRTFFVPGGSGEMLDIGRDTGVPVTEYVTPYGALEGDISHVELNFTSKGIGDL